MVPNDDPDIFDALQTSANWERLRERSPGTAPPEYVALKHDFVNVMMIIAADLQRQQRINRRLARENRELMKDLNALDDRIFDSEKGALPKQERRITKYVDGRVGKLTAVAMAILGSTITGLAVLFLSGGRA